MAYKKIKPQNFTEEELREIWKTEYCNAPIVTFDGVSVKFYEDKLILKNPIHENKTIFFNGFIANDHICTIQQRWLKYGRNF